MPPERRGRAIVTTRKSEKYAVQGVEDAAIECRSLLENLQIDNFSVIRDPLSDDPDDFLFVVYKTQ